MSKAIQRAEQAPIEIKTDADVTAAVVESLVVKGDISSLRPEERARYYIQLCESLGLNPASQPLAPLKLNGKEILYPTKGATDQLAAIHGVQREIIDGPKVIDLGGQKLVYAVCRATLPNGRSETAISTVPLQDPANVYMKCETKGKRRATLSLLGLGMLDESELDTIPAAVKAPGRPIPIRPERAHVEHAVPPPAQLDRPSQSLTPEPGDAFEPDPIATMPDEAVSELETWRKRIEACATMSDLTSLKPQLAALPEAMRRELRPVFEARREELRKPTPPAGGGNRPANDAGEAKGEGAEGEAPADGSPQAYAAHLAALPHVNAVVNSAAKHSVHWGEDAGEYMAVAVREGKARGLSGETFRKRVAERIAQNEARAEKGQAA
jgi:hypothetical protein